MTADDLLAEFGPAVPVPPTPQDWPSTRRPRTGANVAQPTPMPYDRATQERRPAAPNGT